MLVIDGRTGEARSIRAGLPQGSPISPILFILSVSEMFQWLENRHPKLQAILFVDDVGLVTECDGLDDGTRQLENIARDAIQWGSNNKVEFEVSKTEILRFHQTSQDSTSGKVRSRPHRTADLLQLSRRQPDGSAFGSIRSCCLRHTSKTGRLAPMGLYSGYPASAGAMVACPST